MLNKSTIIFATLLIASSFCLKELSIRRQPLSMRLIEKQKIHPKYNLETIKAICDNQNGVHELPLKNAFDAEYWGPVHIGTPGKLFQILFDTGSSNVWVPQKGCTTSGCTGKHMYSCSASSTCQQDGESISIRYGSGAVSGTVVIDTVTTVGLAVKNFKFGQMTSVDSAFKGAPFDGLAGMGFRRISVDNLPTYFDKMYQAGLVADNSFSFYLTQTAGSTGSTLVLGGISSKFYTGKMTYHNLAQESYWVLRMGNIKVNGNTAVSGPITSIVDTGTSLLVGNNNIINGICNAIGVKPVATIPCNKISSYPSIHFQYDQTWYDLPSSQYILKIKQFGKTQCLVGLQGFNIGQNFLIMGDTFIKYWYTHFDVGNDRLGFARATAHVDAQDF